jgi:hypothetical protein
MPPTIIRLPRWHSSGAGTVAAVNSQRSGGQLAPPAAVAKRIQDKPARESTNHLQPSPCKHPEICSCNILGAPQLEARASAASRVGEQRPLGGGQPQQRLGDLGVERLGRGARRGTAGGACVSAAGTAGRRAGGWLRSSQRRAPFRASRSAPRSASPAAAWPLGPALIHASAPAMAIKTRSRCSLGSALRHLRAGKQLHGPDTWAHAPRLRAQCLAAGCGRPQPWHCGARHAAALWASFRQSWMSSCCTPRRLRPRPLGPL